MCAGVKVVIKQSPCPRGIYDPVGERDNKQISRHYNVGYVNKLHKEKAKFGKGVEVKGDSVKDWP